jgi:TRAP transporter TAXI family solute receptor
MSKSSATRSSRSRQQFFAALRHLDPTTRLIFFGLGCLSIGLLGSLVWSSLSPLFRTHQLTLVAGSRDGESFVLSRAIEQVVEARNPKIQINVVETSGTEENIQKLETGAAQLATAQADVPAGSSARTVVLLYADTFQLVVKDNAPIQQFTDLKGKRIGLWQRGGQYRSFLDIAAHYGLQERDFTFVGRNQQESNDAFRQNQVDAIFRVRALGNQTISDLVQQYQGRLVPIDQAAAMRIKYPAFEPAVIPRGAYRGSNPAVPNAELPTIAVQRLLLASSRVDPQVIREITEILEQYRREIGEAIPAEFADVRPLVASISKPSVTGGTGIPLHEGAIAYYERDEPSFIQENADFLALILTVVLLLGSWLWELKAWLKRRQKDEADRHIEAAIQLMTDVQNSQRHPEDALNELDQIFAQAASDLVTERISQESFRTLSEAYKAVRDVIEHKERLLQTTTR